MTDIQDDFNFNERDKTLEHKRVINSERTEDSLGDSQTTTEAEFNEEEIRELNSRMNKQTQNLKARKEKVEQELEQKEKQLDSLEENIEQTQKTLNKMKKEVGSRLNLEEEDEKDKE